MAEWKELARTVPGTLMLLGTEMEALRLIEVAHSKIVGRANLMRRIRQGIPASVVLDDFVDPAPEGVCPTVILNDARRAISDGTVRHAKTGHVFVRYAKHLGINEEPPCQSWDNHYQEAIRLTDDALKRINDAASHAEAAKDAVTFVGVLPSQSLLWENWTLVAEQLMNLAASRTTSALEGVRQIRQEIALDFFDTWTILNRSGE